MLLREIAAKYPQFVHVGDEAGQHVDIFEHHRTLLQQVFQQDDDAARVHFCDVQLRITGLVVVAVPSHVIFVLPAKRAEALP
jgi:hypothetical protein